MTTRMISSTFGGIDYNTGTIPAGNFTAPTPSATFSSPAGQYGTPGT